MDAVAAVVEPRGRCHGAVVRLVVGMRDLPGRGRRRPAHRKRHVPRSRRLHRPLHQPWHQHHRRHHHDGRHRLARRHRRARRRRAPLLQRRAADPPARRQPRRRHPRQPQRRRHRPRPPQPQPPSHRHMPRIRQTTTNLAGIRNPISSEKACTRCWPTATTQLSRWPGCCGPGRLAATPPPITSRCWPPRSRQGTPGARGTPGHPARQPGHRHTPTLKSRSTTRRGSHPRPVNGHRESSGLTERHTWR